MTRSLWRMFGLRKPRGAKAALAQARLEIRQEIGDGVLQLRHEVAFNMQAVRLSAQHAVAQASILAQREMDVRLLEYLARMRRQMRHHVERRSREVANEAKSYADQAVFSLSVGMRAAHNVVATTEKRTGALEQALSGIDALAASLRSLEHQLAELDTRVEGKITAGTWQQHVDAALLNVEGDLSQAKNALISDLRNIEQRMEFIRSETMYELQAALQKSPVADAQGESRIEPKIINPKKVAECLSEGLRLNVGCGHVQPPGYVNVDGRTLPGVDIVAEATAIPVDPGSVSELFSSHLVEHFTRHILERVLLPHWTSLLRPGGSLVTIAPDGSAMLAAVNSGEMSFEDFREVLFGAQDYDGDFHYNLIDPDDYCRILERFGFVDIVREYVGKRNGKCFEFKITARKR